MPPYYTFKKNDGIWTTSAWRELLFRAASPNVRHFDLIDIPGNTRQRALFGLMMFLDFECFRYVCENIPEQLVQVITAQAIAEDLVKGYLYAHRDELDGVPFPSAMGQLAGVFDFLKDGDGAGVDGRYSGGARKIFMPERR